MRFSWLWPCVLALGCRGGPTPPTDSQPATAARIVQPTPAVSAWTLEFPDNNIELRGLEPTKSGGLLIAGHFRGTLNVPGFEPRQARGENDIVVLTVSARGAIEDMKTFGSHGEDAFQSVHGSLVSVRAFGAWTLGDDVIVPPPSPGQVIPPSTSVVLDVATDLQRVASVDSAHRIECWPLADGSALLAAFFDDPDAPASTRLERYKNGTLAWSSTLPDVEATAMTESPSGLWLATRRPRVRTVQHIDVTTGVASEPHLLFHPGFDDLGSFITLSPDGHAWGHTAGRMRADLSRIARPLFATPGTLNPLLDATAMVLDADTSNGDVLVQVLNPKAIDGKGAAVSEPGVYLLHNGVPSKISDGHSDSGRLTKTHAVLISSCESGPCVEAHPR